MSDKSSPSRTSYAYQHRAELPGESSGVDRIKTASPSFDPVRCPYHARQLADAKLTEAQRRDSFMIKRGKPQPVLRPNLVLSLGADRAAFNAAWSREHKEANDHNREQRKQAFKNARKQDAATPGAVNPSRNFKASSRG